MGVIRHHQDFPPCPTWPTLRVGAAAHLSSAVCWPRHRGNVLKVSAPVLPHCMREVPKYEHAVSLPDKPERVSTYKPRSQTLCSIVVLGMASRRVERGRTFSVPQVQSPGETVRYDAAPVRAKAAAKVPQAGSASIPHTLLAHPQPCAGSDSPQRISRWCPLPVMQGWHNRWPLQALTWHCVNWKARRLTNIRSGRMPSKYLLVGDLYAWNSTSLRMPCSQSSRFGAA